MLNILFSVLLKYMLTFKVDYCINFMVRIRIQA
jgi:hypothetical protein